MHITQSKPKRIASSVRKLSQLSDVQIIQLGLEFIQKFAGDAIQALKPVLRDIRKQMEA